MTPINLVNTSEITKVEWLEWRKKGIGGSDASAVLGINKWKSPFEIWHEKLQDYVPEEIASEAAYFGNVLEDLVAKEFQERTGKKVRKHNSMMSHPKYPFMLANIDRRVVGEDAILECKTANQFLAKEWEGEEVPAAYLVQMQHYLAVTGKSKGYFAVLIGGQKFVWKEVQRDEELIQHIITLEKDFWENHVLTGQPPALDGSSAAEKFLNDRFEKASEGEVINLGKNEKSLLDELSEITEREKEIKERKTYIQNIIKNEMKSAETAYVGEYEVSWKNVNTTRVDTKRLRKEHPELVAEYLNESTSRRFATKTI